MLYRDGGLTPFLGNPAIGFGEGVALGGSTVVNGGLLWRTPEFILSEWSEKNKINVIGRITTRYSLHFNLIILKSRIIFCNIL